MDALWSASRKTGLWLRSSDVSTSPQSSKYQRWTHLSISTVTILPGFSELMTTLLINRNVNLALGIYSHIIYNNVSNKFPYGWAITARMGESILVLCYIKWMHDILYCSFWIRNFYYVGEENTFTFFKCLNARYLWWIRQCQQLYAIVVGFLCVGTRNKRLLRSGLWEWTRWCKYGWNLRQPLIWSLIFWRQYFAH